MVDPSKSELRFHVDAYSDQYTLGHTTHKYLTGAEAHALNTRVEAEGGRVSTRPVRVSATTLSFMRVDLPFTPEEK
jgi:hypothetical protein